MGAVEQVQPFISFIEENYPELNEYWEEIAQNDKYGGLELFDHFKQKISVNTLRYAKTTAEIYKYIGDLHGKVVTEIGIGYGGLAYVLSRVFDVKEYHLIDLPEVQSLGLKYLNSLKNPLQDTDFKASVPQSSFLTISEFALSEFSNELTEKYYNDILKNSENLYLMINIHNNNRRDWFLNLLRRDFKLQILEEYPKTIWPNDLIIGKK